LGPVFFRKNEVYFKSEPVPFDQIRIEKNTKKNTYEQKLATFRIIEVSNPSKRENLASGALNLAEYLDTQDENCTLRFKNDMRLVLQVHTKWVDHQGVDESSSGSDPNSDDVTESDFSMADDLSIDQYLEDYEAPTTSKKDRRNSAIYADNSELSYTEEESSADSRATEDEKKDKFKKSRSSFSALLSKHKDKDHDPNKKGNFKDQRAQSILAEKEKILQGMIEDLNVEVKQLKQEITHLKRENRDQGEIIEKLMAKLADKAFIRQAYEYLEGDADSS